MHTFTDVVPGATYEDVVAELRLRFRNSQPDGPFLSLLPGYRAVVEVGAQPGAPVVSVSIDSPGEDETSLAVALHRSIRDSLAHVGKAEPRPMPPAPAPRPVLFERGQQRWFVINQPAQDVRNAILEWSRDIAHRPHILEPTDGTVHVVPSDWPDSAIAFRVIDQQERRSIVEVGFYTTDGALAWELTLHRNGGITGLRRVLVDLIETRSGLN